MATTELSKWVPYKLLYHQEQLLVKWLYTGDKKFIEPFFDESIVKCLSHTYNSNKFKSVSDVQLLEQWSKDIKYIKPSAFIFHVSRCGSTLLSQLLSLSPQNIVLSEVPFFDDLLRLPGQNESFPLNVSDSLFKAAVCFYGQQRSAIEQRLFIKTDSWHILFYERIRRLFPEVPFILLYRSPGDIIVSHQRKRGMHAVPGIIEPSLFGFDSGAIKDLNLDNYLIKVLERYYSAYIEVMHQDKICVIVNYSEGVQHNLKQIEHCIGMQLSRSEWEEVEKRSAFDAKSPQIRFSDAGNQSNKMEGMQQCMKFYNQLENIRISVSL